MLLLLLLLLLLLVLHSSLQQVCEEAVELLVAGVFQGPSSSPPPASRISGERISDVTLTMPQCACI
jgi:hypothetical protein